MTIPTPKMFAVGPLVDPQEALVALKEHQAKPKARPRAERSTPVRNPAFRENEALKALQRKLHAQNK
jgi:hypothetical protein